MLERIWRKSGKKTEQKDEKNCHEENEIVAEQEKASPDTAEAMKAARAAKNKKRNRNRKKKKMNDKKLKEMADTTNKPAHIDSSKESEKSSLNNNDEGGSGSDQIDEDEY